MFIRSTHLRGAEQVGDEDPPTVVSWKGEITSEELRRVILDSQMLTSSTRFVLTDPMYPERGFIAVTQDLAGSTLNLKIMSQERPGREGSSDSMTPLKRRAYAACMPCHKAKTGCDQSRPCHRCIRTGQPDQCMDRPQRRLGRPRKSIDEEDDRNGSGGSVFEQSGRMMPSLSMSLSDHRRS